MRVWPHPLDPAPTARDRLVLRIEAIGLALALLFAALSSCAGWARPFVPIVPKGERFTCTATRVWDGDGPIWCDEGPRIRLARINAQELKGGCRPGAPCPRASGVAARDHLVQLLGGARGRTRDGHILVARLRLACLSDGWGKGDRTAAWCSIGGRDLSAMMVAGGFAARWPNARPS